MSFQVPPPQDPNVHVNTGVRGEPQPYWPRQPGCGREPRTLGSSMGIFEDVRGCLPCIAPPRQVRSHASGQSLG